MKLTFYPTDITYRVRDGKAAILLFGRSTDGQRICVIDENFEPYFTVTGDVREEQLLALKTDGAHVTRVERTTRNLNETPIPCFHVYVNLPKSVPLIKDLCREQKIQCYEYDILYTRRYLIDKKITPLVKTEVECARTEGGSERTEDEGERTEGGGNGRPQTSEICVPVFCAAKIWQESTEILTNPKILSIDIETYNPENKIDMKKNPIIMIGLHGDGLERVITWKKYDKPSPFVEFTASEAHMLLRMAELIQQHEPDLICGYFTDGFDFPYIAERAKHLKLDLPLGLDKSGVDIGGRTEKEARITGIPHIDLFKFVRRVIARSLKTDSFSLDAVSKELLGEQKHDVDMDTFFKLWDNPTPALDTYAQYNLQDCRLCTNLFTKLMPTLFEFVRLIGLPPFDINRMPYSMFVEWYLIFLASRRGEIILNKPYHRDESDRMTDRIQGAFVYEPKPGLYKDITVFDYRSLYPSIIASHNISRGTLNCTCCTEGPTIVTERGTFRYCTKRKGLFASTISDLILVRAEVKKQLKTNKDPLLAARSEALKVLANSFYGYMGFAPARWYSIECAESTTAWARQYIHQAIDTAKEKGFQVLYSDTDSCFILLDKKTKQDALDFMHDVNKNLPGLMELDYEGYYPAGLFVSVKSGEGGAKKKYALLGEKGDLKIKGFESVRRNWSFIAKDVQRKVIEIVLKEQDPKKAKEYVRGVVNDMRANKIPLDKVVIHTALSKDTSNYASIGPHVAAAQRMKERGQSATAGTIVKYVVVKGKGKIRDKVKLPDETRQDEYDGEYYITNQIVPGVERIFAVLGISVDDLVAATSQSSLSGW